MTETAEQKQKRERLENLQSAQKLRPMDDDFMRILFKDDLPLAEHVLRILIGKQDLILESSETQTDMKMLAGARSICLDVYGRDTEGKWYDLEIQRSDEGASAQRARYHSSVMDVQNLKAGQKFVDLPDTYVIFITEKDIYDKGLSIYPIERINIGTDQKFNDGEHILFVNGAYEGADPIGILMHDFRCSKPEDMLDQKMKERTRYLKETEEGLQIVCREIESLREKTRIETKIETRIETRIEERVDSVMKLMNKLKYTMEQAMDFLEIPVSEREVLIERINN